MEISADQLSAFAVNYGLKVVGAILILVLGWIASGIGRRIVTRLLRKTNTDESIVTFAASFTKVLILVFAVVAALAKFGIETTSFVAILGAAGFAVGFALQGSLSSFAAGVLILVFRPYRIGDYINAAGVAGSVKEIRLFNTMLATPDNVMVIVPNSKIYGDVIKNFSGYDTRRVDFVFGIGYGSPIQKAHDIILKIIRTDKRILSEPAPQVAVAELADSSVNIVARPWVKKEDYWDVKFDVTRKVKEAFDENGIEIPFPQQVVHMVSASE
ncbi:MAG: mechanosensitive ion channel family protein [Candidatus Glassbacteria bacterium]